MSLAAITGILLASLLTLFIFSRAFRDTRAFRWSAYALLGMAAGYLAAVILQQVWLPALSPRLQWHPADILTGLLALFFTGLLSLRFTSRTTWQAWSTPVLGLLIGAGGALMLGGAMRAVILPQLAAPYTLNYFVGIPWLHIISILFATFTTLGVLFYLLPEQTTPLQQDSWARWLADGWRLWGYWALMLALGALTASVAGARITLLAERIHWLLALWLGTS